MSGEYTHWNLRVLRHKGPLPYYALHKVYYDGKEPKDCTIKPASMGGESVADVKDYLLKALEACEKPILDWDDINPDD